MPAKRAVFTPNAAMNDPALGFTVVTPDDAADLEYISREIRVATGGDLKVTTVDGTTGVIPVINNDRLPLQVTRIWATGTTASGIVVLW